MKKDQPRRARVWDDESQPEKMREVRTIDTKPDADDEQSETGLPGKRIWFWFVKTAFDRRRFVEDERSRW